MYLQAELGRRGLVATRKHTKGPSTIDSLGKVDLIARVHRSIKCKITSLGRT